MEKKVKNAKKKIIVFEKVFFSYNDSPNLILNDVSFSIEENEYVCIIGHNGSGKSTISKVLSGILRPSSGRILFNGIDIANDVTYLRNNLGMIFQNPDNQFVGLTVADDIAFSLENGNISNTKITKIIDLVSQITGVNKLLNKAPNELSGGQKQRVAIASTLASSPSVIIFDESTSMLDPNAKEDLKNLILELKNRFHKTILSVTHDMEEITKCDRVIVVNKGRIIRSCTPLELFADGEFLQQNFLDFPFAYRICNEINRAKIKNKTITPTFNLDEIINFLCPQKK
jgi:energy-coupling factor transport system ATP-binding protein